MCCVLFSGRRAIDKLTLRNKSSCYRTSCVSSTDNAIIVIDNRIMKTKQIENRRQGGSIYNTKDLVRLIEHIFPPKKKRFRWFVCYLLLLLLWH